MFRSFDPVMTVREFLASLGMPASVVSWLGTVILVAAVGLLAWLSYNFTKVILIRVFTLIVRRTRSAFDDIFLETKMFKRLAMIVPGVVVWYLASWMLRENPGWLVFIHRSASLYIIFYAVLTIAAFIEGWHQVWLMQPLSRGGQ